MTNDPAFSEQARRDYLDRITDLIKEHGHALQGVFGDEEGETFTYTVGMAGVDHPELILFGLPIEIAGALLNDIAARVRDGARFASGQVVNDLVRDYPVVLIGVEDTTEHLTVANSLYGNVHPITALQIVFPDVDGLWPWQDGSRVSGGPILGAVPEDLIR